MLPHCISHLPHGELAELIRDLKSCLCAHFAQANKVGEQEFTGGHLAVSVGVEKRDPRT
jgi:hypothetical protein